MGAPGTNIYSSILARNPVPLFFDNMETEAVTRGNWQHNGTNDTWDWTDQYGNNEIHSWTDSPWDGVDDVNYEPDTNSWLGLFNAIDLVGQFGTKLTFYVRNDLDEPENEPPADLLWIEASSQQGPWVNYGGLYGSSNGTFQEIDLDLSYHDDKPDFLVRFRLQTDSGGEDNGVYIDDVTIAAWDPLIPQEAYDYLQGTSMAAPHVSGLAGLIMAAFPTISDSQVKSRILNGVDPKAGLIGLTVSGGRINAQRSLAIPTAPSGLVARATSESRVNLGWTDNSGTPPGSWNEEDGFRVYRKTEMNGTYTLIGTVTPGVPGTGSTISFLDLSASPGQLYFYRVTAFNWGGNSEPTNESPAITPGSSSASSSGGGGCFVATAAYGSPDECSIDFLRAFRDEYLMAHSSGRKWVELYYRYSPPMAAFIADHPGLRKGARLTLFPLVAFSAGMVQTTGLQKGVIFCLLVGFLMVMAMLSRGRILNRHFPLR